MAASPFDACVLVAPAIAPQTISAPCCPARPLLTRESLIETGTYDVPLITDARALRDEMERRQISVRYVESPQGHNHTAFRDRLPALMKDVFRVRTRAAD